MNNLPKQISFFFFTIVDSSYAHPIPVISFFSFFRMMNDTNTIGGTPHPARSAALQVWQTGMGSTVSIKVRYARPNTIYTVWLRVKGKVTGGDAIGGSPITGGGATALAPGSALNSLVGFTPPYDGTSDPINGWMTDMNGNSDFMIQLDFPFGGRSVSLSNVGSERVGCLDCRWRE